MSGSGGTSGGASSDDGVSGGQWLPIAEAAVRLGVSTDAIRKRISTGTLRGERRDGTRYWLVWLPLEDVSPVGPAEAPPEPPDTPPERQDGPPESLPGASGAAPELQSVPPETAQSPPEQPPERPAEPPEAVAGLVQAHLEALRQLEVLRTENRNLAGQLGFREAQLQQANEALRLLQAPPPERPAEPPEPARRWWHRLVGR